jgi:hemoglobin
LAGKQTDASANPASHYDRIGGGDAVREAVERFYTRVLDDPELEPYFATVNMAEVKRHQVLLLSQVLGGPATYAGRELGAAHSGLGITDDHYDRVVDHLVAVFTELGAEADTIAAAGEVLAAVRADIVESPAHS